MVYVYRDGVVDDVDDDGENSCYKFVERHLVESKEKSKWVPVHLVPVGDQYSDPNRKASNRYGSQSLCGVNVLRVLSNIVCQI